MFLLFVVFSLGYLVNCFGDISCTVDTYGANSISIICVAEGGGGNEGGEGGDGGDGGGDGGGTNGCDCVNMTVDDMVEFKYRFTNNCNRIVVELQRIIDACITNQEILLKYKYDALALISPYDINGNTSSSWVTNTLFNAIQDHPNNFFYKTMRLVYDQILPTTSFRLKMAGAYYALYTLASDLVPEFQNFYNSYENVKSRISSTKSDVLSLQSRIAALPEDPCPHKHNGNGNGSSTGGGGDPTQNDWMTEEQGDAVIEALDAFLDRMDDEYSLIEDWRFDFEAQLEGKFNYLYDIFYTKYSDTSIGFPLFQDSYGFTTNANLWKTVYFEPDEFASQIPFYQPSNILSRIELLLYGMSGVSSGSFNSDDLSVGDDDQLEGTKSDMETSFNDLSNSILNVNAELSVNFDNFSSAVRDFFSAFSSASIDEGLSAGDVFISSYSHEVNGVQVEVPAFVVPSDSDLSFFNSFKSACSMFCSVLFYLAGAFVIWRYWVWFFGWAFKFFKWASELISSMFAT